MRSLNADFYSFHTRFPISVRENRIFDGHYLQITPISGISVAHEACSRVQEDISTDAECPVKGVYALGIFLYTLWYKKVRYADSPLIELVHRNRSVPALVYPDSLLIKSSALRLRYILSSIKCQPRPR